ncbi:4828_t:CDS:1, partial [Dentiscutata erythropus]
LSGMSLETKKTISPKILQETEDPLELFKRTQKDAKKSRAVARADIFKQSTPK